MTARAGTRSSSWKAIRGGVLAAFGGVCHLCGETASLVAPAASGPSSISNLRPYCDSCMPKHPKAKLPAAIVIHHGLARHVLGVAGFRTNAGRAVEYRLYVVAHERLFAGALRGIHGRSTHPRNGVVRTDVLVGALAGLPGKPLGDRRNVRATLQAGEGLFWDTAGGNVRFPSPDNLAVRLGLDCAGHRVTAYPVAKLGKGVAAFRDMLRDALMPSAPTRLARATQAARTSTSPSTQQRREAAGKALYSDGNGNAPVSQGRALVDMTLLCPPTFSTGFVASEYRHEGLFAHRNADGEARMFRQAPKVFQAGTPSRRRKPRSHCSGHRLTGQASGTRFLRYGATSAKAKVTMVPTTCGASLRTWAKPNPTSERVLVAVPHGPEFSFEDYVLARADLVRKPQLPGVALRARLGRSPTPDLGEAQPQVRKPDGANSSSSCDTVRKVVKPVKTDRVIRGRAGDRRSQRGQAGPSPFTHMNEGGSA